IADQAGTRAQLPPNTGGLHEEAGGVPDAAQWQIGEQRDIVAPGCGARVPPPSQLGHLSDSDWLDIRKTRGFPSRAFTVLAGRSHRPQCAADWCVQAACSQLIIHGVPNRSTSMPKRAAQKVFWIGICTVPFSDNA